MLPSMPTRRVRLKLVTGMAAMCAAAAGSDLPPAADTYVVAQSASNFGTQPSLNVAPGSQALLQFDLRGLAAGTTGNQLSRVNLRLYFNRVTTPGQIDIGLAGAPWTESGVTGLTAPVVAKSIAAGVAVPAAGNYLTVDVTSAARVWVDSPSANNGLVISASPANPASAAFDSKENPTTSHPAMLEVILSGPQGPAGPQGIAGPAGAEVNVTLTTVCNALGYADTETCQRGVGQAKSVFVTRTFWGGDLGGIAGADAACQKEASDAQLEGRFLAWMSDDTVSPSTRFSKIGAYHTTDSSRGLIASSYTELITSGPRLPIIYSADGRLSVDGQVWTGTQPNGTRGLSTNCRNWTSSESGQTGTPGRIRFGTTWQYWTESPFNVGCQFVARVYCFQQ